MLMTWDSVATQDLLEYSLHYYTDLGAYDQCASNADGSYMQIALNLSEFPLSIPLSFCLPKECSSVTMLDGFVEGMNMQADMLLT